MTIVSKHIGPLSAKIRLDVPEDAKATITITTTVKNWAEIAETLSTEKYAQWPLRAVIAEAIRNMHQSFYGKEETSE